MRSLFFGLSVGLALWVWGSGAHPPYTVTGFLSCLAVGAIVATPVHWLE